MTRTPEPKPRMAVLVSGRGRNLQAIVQRCRQSLIVAEISAVLCNRADAPALDVARRAGLPCEILPHSQFPSREAFEAALAAALRRHAPDIVALAGFMRVLGPTFVAEFEGRMLNVHPSLLPRHPGLNTHRAVLEAGETEHGATVHFVTPAVDTGARVIQGRLAVLPGEDEQSLAARVLECIELRIYPQALAWMARGELCLAGGVAVFRDRALSEPLGLDELEEAFR